MKDIKGNSGADADISPWKPFPERIFDPKNHCTLCPWPGPKWVWQRALIRAGFFLEFYGCVRIKILILPIMICYYFIALFLEVIFQMKDLFSWKNIVSFIAIIFLFLPPIMLWKYPSDYTPMVATLLNSVLFVLSLYISRLHTLDSATKKANTKWLPQATGACFHLLTVWASVLAYRSELLSTCAQARQDLPELEKEEFKAVRTMISNHCNNGSARLKDVANHLEDSLEDWQRFIGANCEGAECRQISSQIKQRREILESGLPKVVKTCSQTNTLEGKKE
jgi:hypothetical protein